MAIIQGIIQFYAQSGQATLAHVKWVEAMLLTMGNTMAAGAMIE
jgi:hypothetical protein